MSKQKKEIPPEMFNPAKAVIDIGSTSVRMLVAQTDAEGTPHVLDSLSQSVSLGRDTFTKGYIAKETIEECVSAIQSFRKVLDEYRIIRKEDIRAVATNAVREASNQDVFLNRILISTGIAVETMDDAEENRFTYLSVQPYLKTHPLLKKPETLIIEVGGGSTGMMLLEHGQVVISTAFRLGSFRIRESLGDYEDSDAKHLEMIENQINPTVRQIREHLTVRGKPNMLCIGGDVRFAGYHLLPEWDKTGIARIPLTKLANFTNEILSFSVDEIVRKYHVTYPEAETLGPALLTYVRLAAALKLKQVLITSVTMRDGLLTELSEKKGWTDELKEQIICSAMELGKKYDFDQRHAEQVMKLSRELFHALADEHKLSPRFELILILSALLHEIGLFIGTRSHHKHSLYLILHSNLFGLSGRDLLLTALVSRYHRRAQPKPSHEYYQLLDQENRIIVSKLAAILRVADSLERSYAQRIQNLEVRVEDKTVVLIAKNVTDLSLEQMALRQKGNLFEDVYGKNIILRKARKKETE